MTNVEGKPFPVSGKNFDISHPDSQRPQVKVLLTSLDTNAYQAVQLSLVDAKKKFPSILWLTGFNVIKGPNTPKTGNDVHYTVEIDMDYDPPANMKVYLLTDANSNPVAQDATRDGRKFTFPLQSPDPMVGIG